MSRRNGCQPENSAASRNGCHNWKHRTIFACSPSRLIRTGPVIAVTTSPQPVKVIDSGASSPRTCSARHAAWAGSMPLTAWTAWAQRATSAATCARGSGRTASTQRHDGDVSTTSVVTHRRIHRDIDDAAYNPDKLSDQNQRQQPVGILTVADQSRNHRRNCQYQNDSQYQNPNLLKYGHVSPLSSRIVAEQAGGAINVCR